MIKKIFQSGSMLSGVVLILPDSFDPTKTYTGILFAHGIGERGTDPSNIETFFNQKCPNIISLVQNSNCILIAPQLPSGSWSPNYFDFAFSYLSTNYKIGPRVNITGVSWGGQEIWQWAGLHNDKIIGILACCACYADTNFCAIKQPVLAYHASGDPEVPYSEGMTAINKINACNPPQPAKMITYNLVQHEIWNTVYGEPDVIKFLTGAAIPIQPIVPINPPPLTVALKADASATLTSVMGTNAVLDGTKSTGYKNSWSLNWALINQPAGSTWDIWDMPNSSKSGEVVKLKNLVPGSYVFELNAADGHGNVSTDKVTINVSSVPTGKTQVGSGVIAASGKSAILYSDNTWL